MKNLTISAGVLEKLRDKHQVTRTEVEQCFNNISGKLLEDTRDGRATEPPTLWFIACTNKGRRLKVVYIQKGSVVELKSAFEPNETEERIYTRHG